jgi:selenide, water dikinase
LAQVVRPLMDFFPATVAPDVIIGLGAVDDAAVHRIGGGRVSVVSLDFFPPVVDDATDYGAIAAANSMSDVWAMGAEPVLALCIALFPKDMPTQVASAVLLGAAERVRAAGAVIAGGHTMDSAEPVFGLAVIGLGDEDELMLKGGLEVGQKLVLSKPLGSGLLTTAAKHGKITSEDLADVIGIMKRLNGPAARVGRQCGVRGATDITGFGLAGHALEMAEGAGVGLRLGFDAVPLMESVMHWAEQGAFAGGAHRNRKAYQGRIDFAASVSEPRQMLLFDPQTSGGLLMGVAADRADALLAKLRETDPEAAIVGEVVEGEGMQVV